MTKSKDQNEQAAPMTYERQRVTSARRHFADAIDRGESAVELPAAEVASVEITPTAPAKGAKKEA